MRECEGMPPDPSVYQGEAFLRPPGRTNEWKVHQGFARMVSGAMEPMEISPWLLPNVRSGEVITGIYLPESGAQFLHQGKAVGEIRELEFARRFFGIWLSPQTSQPQLRQQLLAGASP